MDIQKDNCVEALKRLGMADAGEYLGDYGQKGIFLQLESGQISAAQFRDGVRAIIGKPVTDEQIDTAFNAFLTGIPVERLRELERLHRHYHIYMLSNTNPIMWDSVIKDQFRKDGHDMDYYFDGTVTSFEAKVCKPDPAIFRFVTGKLHISPEDTLFLDDSEGNCEAARRLGFKAAHVPSDAGFEDVIEHALLTGD